MAPSIDRIEILLLIAALVAIVARRLRLPYTVGLTLAGIALAFGHAPVDFPLTKSLIFNAFLPPLIFEAAFHMRWRELRDDAPVVLVLATAGVLLACSVVTAGLHYLAAWPWAPAVLLGLLISATDPVSVIATFKEAGVTGRLRLLIEAESLLNDGTAAVFYAVALTAILGGTVSVGGVAGSFLLTVAGGVFCGAMIGGAMLLMVGHTEDHLVEITFTTVAAYGSFLLAEHFRFSGVLATLTAGILIGNTGLLGTFSTRGREAVESFWEYVGFVANSLIFLLIGIHLVAEDITSMFAIAQWVIILMLLGRAVAVYACCAPFSHSVWRVSMAHQFLLVWGGLRGALALALALGLPADLPRRAAIISITFTVVAFSVVVQGLPMKPLLRWLGEFGPHSLPETDA